MPMTLDEAFGILGVTSSSSEAEVKSAYKKLALKTHPDKNPNDPDAGKKFLRVSEAYKRITDPESFKDEDEEGEPSEEEMTAMFNMMFAEMFSQMGGVRGGRGGRGGRGDSFSFGIPMEMFDMMEMMMEDEEGEDDEEEMDMDDMEDMVTMMMMGGGMFGGVGGGKKKGGMDIESLILSQMMGGEMDFPGAKKSKTKANKKKTGKKNGGSAKSSKREDSDDEDGEWETDEDDKAITSKASKKSKKFYLDDDDDEEGDMEDMDEEEIMAFLAAAMGGGMMGGGGRAKPSAGASTKKGSKKGARAVAGAGMMSDMDAAWAGMMDADGPRAGGKKAAKGKDKGKDKNTSDGPPPASKADKSVRTTPSRESEDVHISADSSSGGSSKMAGSAKAKAKGVEGADTSKGVARPVSNSGPPPRPSGPSSTSSAPSSSSSKPIRSEGASGRGGGAGSSEEEHSYRVGDRVILQGRFRGDVAFVGEVHYTKGVYVGIVMDDVSAGKNNGVVKGVRYFDCPAGRGLMVRAADQSLAPSR